MSVIKTLRSAWIVKPEGWRADHLIFHQSAACERAIFLFSGSYAFPGISEYFLLSVICLLADHRVHRNHSNHGFSAAFRVCSNNTPHHNLRLCHAPATDIPDPTSCDEARPSGHHKQPTRAYHAHQKPRVGTARKHHLPTRRGSLQAVDELLLGPAGVRGSRSMRRPAPRRSAALHGCHCPQAPL